MGWRDEAEDKGTKRRETCDAGKCSCRPTCAAQAARVDAFLAGHRQRVPERTLRLQLVEPVSGHAWVCVSCRTEQPGPGAHCGYRIVLVERRGLELDATGRVTKATSAQVIGYYRASRDDGKRGKAGWDP